MAISENEGENVIHRKESSYKNLSSRFFLKERSFGRQYAVYYASRLKLMREKLKISAVEKWGKKVKFVELCDLNEDDEVCIIGTLFKHMELQPSIVKEISEEHNLEPQPFRDRYSDDSDLLFVEDEVSRVPLKAGKGLDVHSHVTGVVVALLGRETEGGKFVMNDYCYSNLPEQVERPLMQEDKYVAFVSGLTLARSADALLPLQLLVDFLIGDLGGDEDSCLASKITRIVIAGNSVSHAEDPASQTVKYLTRKTKSSCLEGVQVLDDMLQRLTASLTVDLMPGEHDPASRLLPQQPLHSCIFPKSSLSSGLHTVTNPYEVDIDGTIFLGTSGQNVTSVSQYSKLCDALEIMEKTLNWGHLAPTAPDVLSCYPFYDKDPFILDSCPHVYFVGNQSSFATKIFKGKNGQIVRLISLPHFHKTFTCVLVNLKNLDCTPVQLNINLNNE